MKTTLLARLGAIGMTSVTLLAGVAAPTGHSNSFRAALTGDVRATISGTATFGRVTGGIGAPDAFTLNLGTDSFLGAVLFTRTTGTGLSVGSYPVSDAGHGSDEIQALVMLGRADRPAGVFRVQSGTLTITSVSDHLLTGLFALDATGFLASAPQRENQQVHVSGSFTARGND
ncbi:MAG TPA: hypothetical protein VGJ36_07710 [Gemmatimonadales bacterium]|jgi:hypothetical protein